MDKILNETELENALSFPTEAVVEALRRNPGDIIILGVAGKMGPSLARMARRASDSRRIIGVARFSNPTQRESLEQGGIDTIACDLLNESQVECLPDAPNVIYLAGRKFGSTGNESLTWAINAVVPSIVARRYRSSRIVALSTGNVYGLVPCDRPSRETDVCRPVGEYAMSCLARERIFEHFSRTMETPMAVIRLNYACDLRYGVLVDLACRILINEPIDLGMGSFNTIWQGDANAMILQALDQVASPPRVINVTGPEVVSVQQACERLARLLNVPLTFMGEVSGTALLSDSSLGIQLFGRPTMSACELIERVVGWIRSGGRLLDKPTHFESRSGDF